MAIKNKTKYAILGVLCMKPCSGYDIKKFCDKTISHFWNENFGHIYPVLKQLQENHLICLEEMEVDQRRKIYHITEEGKQEFQAWLVQTPQLQPPRSELMLKLSFGNHMPQDRFREMIEDVRFRNQENLVLYRTMEASYLKNEEAKKDPAYPYWLSSLLLGIMNAETVLCWCDEVVQIVKSFPAEGNSQITHESDIAKASL